MSENPFEAFDLDPLASVEEITERFRELAETATEERRMELRAAWEALTLHPRARIAAALSTFVSPGPAVAVRPPPRRAAPSAAEARATTLLDRAPIEGVAGALDAFSAPGESLLVRLADDPLLEG